MYYKYFNEITTATKVKQILIDLLKSVIYALILTLLIAYAIGFRPVYIIGDSMGDEIDKYDLILIKPVKEESIKVGDVITYTGGSSGESLTTHRIFGIEDGMFYTKDEPTVDDWKEAGITFEQVKGKCEPITFERIKGRYVHKFVVVGNIVEFMTLKNGQGLNVASVIDVVLTLAGMYGIILIFRSLEDKYYAQA